jgi:hypothetical protein
MTEQEEFDRAEQEIKTQIEAICKAHNLSAEQCQNIQEKLGLGHVFDWERAREIRDGLNSDNPSMRLRAVKAILDLTRILAIGVVDTALTRVDRLEARIEKLEKERAAA